MSSDDAHSSGSLEDVIESTPSVLGLPTTQQLLIYIFTTVLVWTSEPLLSIVDSATVGSFPNHAAQQGIPSNLASVVQLAALGPATMLCDSSIFLTYFIGLAATNKLARASTKKDWKSMIEVSSHSLGVSVALGVLVFITLILFGEPLLRSIIGPGGAIFNDVATNKSVDLTGEVVRIALGYTWIRAIAAGFAITGSTAQSLLLCEY
jgi:Na+-driven multidrug efflux pump